MKNPPPRPSAAEAKGAARPSPTVLVLLRHGDAGDALARPERDALRPLTPKGRKQAKRAGKALARLGLSPRDVWTSRLARAAETARTALRCTGTSPRVTETAALSPDATPERILRALVDTPPPSPPVEADRKRPRAAKGRPVGRRSRPPIEPTPVVRWLVGHDPHLVRFAALATGAPVSSLRLGKGAFAILRFDGRGPAAGIGLLTELLDAEALKALAKHGRA